MKTENDFFELVNEFKNSIYDSADKFDEDYKSELKKRLVFNLNLSGYNFVPNLEQISYCENLTSAKGILFTTIFIDDKKRYLVLECPFASDFEELLRKKDFI